jgi:hypothetical protein
MRPGYLADSSLSDADGLGLHTALGQTPLGRVDHPELFRGFLSRPDVAAAGILAVADVAATRYADFGLARRLANLDPVVTVSGDRVRFESFSACNGVHARFDLLPDGIDSGQAGFGTTNVDINQPLRTALAGVGAAGLLHMAIGSEELRISTPDATYTEERVNLPDRWVRGFAETPLLAKSMSLATELTGPAVARFVGSLPRAGTPGPDLHLLPVTGWLRTILDAARGSVLLAGSSRLRSAARLVRFATGLRIYSSEHGTSGWVFEVPGGRLTLLLTAGAYRGFSGEGSLLTLLAAPEAEQVGRRIRGALAWEPAIDPALLERALDMTPDEVASGLAWLAASGRIGYDMAEADWFHRELPVDTDMVLRRNPRLVSAQRLVENHAVHRDEAHWTVQGSKGTAYRVTAEGDRLCCDCPWAHDHQAGRGPCKHVLAVLITSRKA